ncbi:MAG: hypothetical protein ABI670_15020 [Chloroflexota bacterium]
MGDNQRQVIRHDETVDAGQPAQTTVTQTGATTGTPAAPVASQMNAQTTTTTTNPGDRLVAHNVSERVVDPAAEKAASVDWFSRAIWFLVGLFSVLLLIRFGLLAAGANENTGFAQLIYGVTGWLVAPFAGLFGGSITYPGAAGTGVVEFESLVAIVVVALVGWIISKLAQLALGTNRTTGTTYSETEHRTKI